MQFRLFCFLDTTHSSKAIIDIIIVVKATIQYIFPVCFREKVILSVESGILLALCAGELLVQLVHGLRLF